MPMRRFPRQTRAPCGYVAVQKHSVQPTITAGGRSASPLGETHMALTHMSRMGSALRMTSENTLSARARMREIDLTEFDEHTVLRAAFMALEAPWLERDERWLSLLRP